MQPGLLYVSVSNIMLCNINQPPATYCPGIRRVLNLTSPTAMVSFRLQKLRACAFADQRAFHLHPQLPFTPSTGTYAASALAMSCPSGTGNAVSGDSVSTCVDLLPSWALTAVRAPLWISRQPASADLCALSILPSAGHAHESC